MSIQVGTSAPAFSTRDTFGAAITLEDYRGKWLLLSFLRNGACALCNLHVHHLIEAFPKLHAQGLEIVTVFESPASSVEQNVGKQDAPFAIIADPEAKLYAMYGVEISEEKVNATVARLETPAVIRAAAEHGFQLTPEEGSNFYRMPAEFLIGPDGVVRIAHYANYIYDTLDPATLEEALTAKH